ncbi:MAG: DUF4446 family protein [Clostridiaceae bacterium]|nr:DUF4446 family protein [Clostridiaceae bacterium]MBW4859253.1 DUF4446 family protein [Clostridiaceae bacterium]MBW4869275.1 DUF4446 family protein [Clostridiaceae bacterium]
MEQLREIIINYNVEVTIILMFAFILVLILYIISEFRINHITDKYNALVKGVEAVNLEELISEALKEVEKIKEDYDTMEEKYDEIDRRLKFAIQKVGFIRYNAFADMGSELSFSIALLDDNLDGLVITSIFGRDYSTSYAKAVVNGESKHSLSVEEMQAMDRAIKVEKYAGIV